MKKTYILMCLGLAGVATFSSCKKDAPASTPAPSANTAPSVTAPSNADGALAAVVVKTNTVTYGIPYSIEIGTAAAWFGLSSSYKDAGNVSVDNNALTKNSNAYVFQPTATSAMGLTFGSAIAWTVSGNAGNNIPAFNYTDNSSFPDVDDISSSITTVSSSTAFTLSASSSTSGDSVIFVVAGSRGHVTYTAAGGTTSHTFSATEMGTVGTAANNTGLVQIAPYRINHQTIGGKSYYFIKETCASKSVTIN